MSTLSLQMQMGRRTASLKASYEAINSGLNPNLYNFNPMRDHSPNSDSLNRSNAFGYGYESGLKSGQSGANRNNKRARTSQYGSDTSSNSHITVNNVFEENSSEGLEGNGPPDWTYDPNEPRYCICNNVSYGEMIACDNEDVSRTAICCPRIG